LFERNCYFNSCLKRSHISIFKHPTLKSSLVLVLHQSLASPVKYIMMRSTCSATPIFTTLKYCSMSYKKFSSSFEILAPSKDFSLGTLGLYVLTPIKVFVIARFRMEMVSSTASNRSLNSASTEMYKLSALPAFSIASFKQSMIKHSSPSSSCPIKVSRRINHSRIASMTLGWMILESTTLWYQLSQG